MACSAARLTRSHSAHTASRCPDGRRAPDGQGAGVVDHDVEPAEPGERLPHRGEHGGTAGDVDGPGSCPATPISTSPST
jgi:hypothetical protein